jgi:hypothetical protein
MEAPIVVGENHNRIRLACRSFQAAIRRSASGIDRATAVEAHAVRMVADVASSVPEKSDLVGAALPLKGKQRTTYRQPMKR